MTTHLVSHPGQNVTKQPKPKVPYCAVKLKNPVHYKNIYKWFVSVHIKQHFKKKSNLQWTDNKIYFVKWTVSLAHLSQLHPNEVLSSFV